MLTRGGGYGTPLAIHDYPPTYAAGFQDTTGKVLVDSAVVPGERTGIFLIPGQSLGCNTCSGTPYVPASPRVHNFNIYDRKTYLASGPLLGCVNGPSPPLDNFLTEMADMLIAAGTFDRVILIPVGVGATSAQMWGYDGIFNHRLQIAIRCLPLFGAPLTGVLWVQGEEDNGRSTPAAQYVNYVRGEMVGTVRGMGCNAPFFFPLETMLAGVTSSVIRGAQGQLVDGVTLFAGPDMDSITLSERQADQTHLTAVGRHHAANLWQAILSTRFH